ncbi:MAG: endonuclease I [Spirochaetia bacterium]|nr:endonuclease I [Spirochaetia bacterium]
MAAKRGCAVGRYRSGLEDKIAAQLESAGVKYAYEDWKIPYVIPASNHSYKPDFILPNNIIIEAKGIFDTDDRTKHLLIREQYPELEIRFVFSSVNTKIYSGSKTTVAAWCDKYGFKFAAKLIPAGWLKEKGFMIPSGILLPVKKSK